MKTKNIFIIIFLTNLVFPLVCSAQFNYGVSISGGASNIYKIDKDINTNNANYFEMLPSFSVDGFIIEKIKNSRYSFEQGVSFESSGAEVWIPLKKWEDMVAAGINWDRMWHFRTYQLSIPLRVRFDFEKWLTFHAGLSNTFYIKGEDYYVNRKYSLRGEAGADVLIKQRYIVGIKGSYDLTPTGRFQDDDISFHYYNASLKVGVLLNSFKK